MASAASPEFTASTFDNLHTKLEKWFDATAKLRPDSPQALWDDFASYLSPDCELYLSGVTGAPSRGPAEAIAAFRKTVTFWEMKEQRVLSRGIDLSGRVLTVEMNNRLAILGEEMDFPEVAVVTFNDKSQIIKHKLYCDPSPVMAVFKKNQEKAQEA
ncbi:hypothetical protein G7046_g3462 [Stylonectria norvegica]|nr:hypothetical protein G7046_g3462 [Stylonectria norvegica]